MGSRLRGNDKEGNGKDKVQWWVVPTRQTPGSHSRAAPAIHDYLSLDETVPVKKGNFFAVKTNNPSQIGIGTNYAVTKER